MKKYLLLLAIPLVLLSGCYPKPQGLPDSLNLGDIAYKTTNYTYNYSTGSYDRPSYYLVDKNGKWYPVYVNDYKTINVSEK